MAPTKKKLQIFFNKKGIGRTAPEWSKILGISTNQVRYRARHGLNISDPKDAPFRCECPVTGRIMTIPEWAEWLGIDENTFKKRRANWGKNNPKVYRRDPPRKNSPPNQLHVNAKKRNILFCTNPETGESKLAWEWARHYGVSLAEINQAINDYGRNSRQLYRHLESRKV